jgi:imidazolonepropionase-like amidohydrolase
VPALHVRGVLLPDEQQRDLWIVDGRISTTPMPDATSIGTGFVLPGLVDAHCHIGLGFDGPVEEAAGQEEQAVLDRDSGALLVRDCGSPVDTHWIDERPDLPRIVRAGRHLARPRRYLPGIGLEIEPEELPAAAEIQAKAGDGWVKLVGDWIDRAVGDLTPLWPADALRSAVERAHVAGARVTVHTFCEEALPDLLDAGVDCIEHGTGLSDELIGVMAERGTALVPTLINIDTFPAIADRASRFPAYAAHMRRLHATARDRVRTAVEAGVPVFAGSDAGGGIAHGRIADEAVALHEAGLPATDAIAATSWRAREWLGLPGLEDGVPADLTVYPEDPRDDLRILAAPTRIVLRGRVIR